MKTLRLLVCLLSILPFMAPGATNEGLTMPKVLPHTQPGKVYVIPIHDVIDSALIYVIRRGLNEAEDEGAEAIIFDMDTPGGRVDAAEEILNMLRGSRCPPIPS